MLNWLDGKKTAIAAVLLIVTNILDTAVGTFGADPANFDTVRMWMMWVGGILGGGGIFHKGMKGELKAKRKVG